MKKLMVIACSVVLLLGMAGGASAASKNGGGGSGVSIDGTLSLATDPTESMFGLTDLTLGIGLGLSADISQDSSKTGKLQFRGDFIYYDWDVDAYFFDVSYERVPLFLGVRYFFPMDNGSVGVFVEGGLEISFDKVEVPFYNPFFGLFGKVEDDETNLGITPGIGIEVPIQDNLYFGSNLRFHFISDSYASLGVTLGYRF